MPRLLDKYKNEVVQALQASLIIRLQCRSRSLLK
jgi:hypothetical protein